MQSWRDSTRIAQQANNKVAVTGGAICLFDGVNPAAPGTALARTATLLLDGQVLIAGGTNFGRPQSI
jgi:hypothetical protein